MIQRKRSHLPLVLPALAALALLWGGDARSVVNFVLPPPPPPPVVTRDSLFFDDFSRPPTRWTFDRDSVWAVREGVLWAALPDGRQLRSFAYAGSEDWTDYAVDLDVCQLRGVDKGVIVRAKGGSSGTGVDVRGPGYQDVLLYRRELPLARARAESGNGTWHHLRVECRGGSTTVLLDGATVLRNGNPRTPGGSGRIALPAYTGGTGECTVVYDNVLVTRLR
jgi:hypothetical protein